MDARGGTAQQVVAVEEQLEEHDGGHGQDDASADARPGQPKPRAGTAASLAAYAWDGIGRAPSARAAGLVDDQDVDEHEQQTGSRRLGAPLPSRRAVRKALQGRRTAHAEVRGDGGDAEDGGADARRWQPARRRAATLPILYARRVQSRKGLRRGGPRSSVDAAAGRHVEAAALHDGEHCEMEHEAATDERDAGDVAGDTGAEVC
eukprot:15469934-Alexandrium_andersonii.AAC.1